MREPFIIAYILFICAFAFLPKSAEMGIFLLFVLGSAGIVLANNKRYCAIYSNDADTKRLVRLFSLFLFVATIYLFLSFLNLPRIWGVKDLRFGGAHIPRHFIIIAELFLPIYLGHALYATRFFERIKLVPLFLFFFLVFSLIRELCVVGPLLLTLALISWKLDMKFLMYLAIFVVNGDSSASLLGYLVIAFLVFFEKPITHYLRKNTLRKIIAFSLLGIFGVIISSSILAYVIESDPNSLWRLRVWWNEITSLAQTGFTGVGFGAAYVTDDIFFQVDNSNMYLDDSGRDTGVFLVANHSSILNMFYRMGLLGGFLFLAMIVQIVLIVIKTYQKADRRMKALLWRIFSVFLWEIIIICLNPGLEMMQFALGFILCLSALFAIVLVIQKRPRFYYSN